MNYSIEEILEAVNQYGSQAKAAKALGIPRSTLGDKIRAKEPFLSKEADSLGFPAEDVSGYWVKSATGSYYVRRDTSVDYNDIREEFINKAHAYAPVYKKIDHEGGKHLLIVDPADVHIGKLSAIAETGYDYNTNIAVVRMQEGVRSLVSKAKVFGIEKIIFVLGNDILHVDSSDRKTTAGTPQDTDGQWWQAYNAAKAAYIECVETLSQVAPVHLVHCPSNHDWKSGLMLADSVCSWFRNNPNVSIKDGSVSISHRKYVQYGVNLIGFTHGDGAKENELAQLMQYEARSSWGNSKYGYWYTHHLHHKKRKTLGLDNGGIEKDHLGVTMLTSRPIDPTNNVYVEIVRSPSPADGWHHRNGYLNEQAIECFLHHEERGQVVRFTEYF